jgi:hypothetical protein
VSIPHRPARSIRHLAEHVLPGRVDVHRRVARRWQALGVEPRAGHVHRLYVFKLDRLARSGIRDTFEVIEELRAHGAELVSVSDGFALDGPVAEVVLAVMAWAAKMERLAINERISAARERVESEGRSWGRPARLSAEEFTRVRKLRAEGRSLRQVAAALKVPPATVEGLATVLAGFKGTFQTWRYMHEGNVTPFDEGSMVAVIGAVFSSIVRLRPDLGPLPGVIVDPGRPVPWHLTPM